MSTARTPLEFGRRLWRGLAIPSGLRRRLQPAASAILRAAALGVGETRLPVAKIRPGPLVIGGYFSDALGIGRAGRLTADALAEAGFCSERLDVGQILRDAPFQGVSPPGADGDGVLFAHCNAPEAEELLIRLQRGWWRAKYRIGYWAWELPRAPARWLRASRLFHEIWTPSAFVAEALEGAKCPVRVMPHPVPDLGDIRPDRARFGLEPDGVYALCMADLRSSAERKNPFGAIAAYCAAYPEPAPGRGLLVKLVASGWSEAAMARLEAAAQGRPDIRILRDELSDAETMALIAGCDVFVSLHRAEGLGLGLAEAMSLGRATVATAWSGNMEFMRGLEAALVPCRLIPVDDPYGVYPSAGQRWADPDIGAAGDRLRHLMEDKGARRALAAEGPPRIAQLRAAWSRQALERLPFAKLAAR